MPSAYSPPAPRHRLSARNAVTAATVKGSWSIRSEKARSTPLKIASSAIRNDILYVLRTDGPRRVVSFTSVSDTVAWLKTDSFLANPTTGKVSTSAPSIVMFAEVALVTRYSFSELCLRITVSASSSLPDRRTIGRAKLCCADR